jgi:ribonuclease Z
MVFNVTRQDIATRLAITPTLVWPNKERHEGFRAAAREKRPTMSRWLADKQLFPKF